jgi:hypothetical protein
MQHIQTLNMLFSGTPQFRFNRHQNKLMLDIDWSQDAQVGKYVIIECYRALIPETITLTGTVSGNTSSNTLIGTGTVFDQEVIENDFLTLSDGQQIQIRKINSPTQIVIAASALTANVTGNTITKVGTSDVWNDRFLKQYVTAKIKYQWGSNLSKFAGVQLPGGVTLDGPRIMEEAQREIDKIEEEMTSYNVLPSEMFMG